MVNKIDSNVTGLRYAEEATLKKLPASPVFHMLEPNSYSDFGGQIATVARNPINASRQRKKGVVTDLDASGGFNQDLTTVNTTRLLQGFFFADAREKWTSKSLLNNTNALVAVTAEAYTVTGAPVLPVGTLIKASGFNKVANNGIKKLAVASTASAITVSGLAVEATSANARLEVVGQEFDAGDISIALNGGFAQLTSATVDMTTLGPIPGEWVFIGGDSVTNRFENSYGFARIGSVSATYIELDKISWEPVVEDGAGVSLHVYFGTVIKNESERAKIKRRTYHVERTLDNDNDGTMSEYLVGAVPNEFTMTVSQADKVTIDMSFVALDNEQRTGVEGLKGGSRPILPPSDAFNTSTDFTRIKLAPVDLETANPKPLFAYATEMTLTINNNVSANKAIGVLGGFDTTAGTFEVGGSMTVYFADIKAVRAVRENADITLDAALVKDNAGMVFDIPLLSLGDGRLSVEQDQPITLPLENNAAESKFGHTLLFNNFAYLPDIAQ